MTAVLFNGQAAAPELALHRGLHYGDGVFRTCLINAGQVVDLQGQLEKLETDARQLGLTVPAAALAGDAQALASGQSCAVLKMMLLRGGRERGYRPRTEDADRLLCRYPAPRLSPEAWQRGIQAARSPFRLAPQPALAGIKHLNRLEQVLAGRDWPDEVDELLVADDEGRPIGGTRTNLFWVRDGVLQTPPLARCGVAGRMRDRVLQAAVALGLTCRVEAGTWDLLDGADEVFVTNSIVGIWPLARLDRRAWSAPGPATQRLMEKIAHPRVAA